MATFNATRKRYAVFPNSRQRLNLILSRETSVAHGGPDNVSLQEAVSEREGVTGELRNPPKPGRSRQLGHHTAAAASWINIIHGYSFLIQLRRTSPDEFHINPKMITLCPPLRLLPLLSWGIWRFVKQ